MDDDDFSADVGEIQFKPQILTHIELLLSEVTGRPILLADGHVAQLRGALAQFVAQERFRAAVPTRTKLRQITSIKRAAYRLQSSLTKLEEGDVDWILSSELPSDSREQFLKTLSALSAMNKPLLEYPPAAPELDAKLRALWAELTDGAGATLNNSLDAKSPFNTFLDFVYQALPVDVSIGESSKAAGARPAQLLAQRTESERRAADFARQSLLAERFEVTAQNVISELGKIAFANVGDFYTVGQGGRLEVDPSTLANPAKTAAVSQIEITETSDGKQTIKIRLADKRAALNDLGKHLGLFEERMTVQVEKVHDDASVDVRELALAALALFADAQDSAATVRALPPPRAPDLDDLEPWYFDQGPA